MLFGKADNTMGTQIEILVCGRSTDCVIATIASGGKYWETWNKICRRGWVSYGKRHGIDILVVKESISSAMERRARTIHWDKLLLNRIPEMRKYSRVAWVDSDIMINHWCAPNVFEVSVPSQIGAVSLMFGFPYDLLKAKRRVVYLRHKYVDSTYPLNSIMLQDDNLTYPIIGKPILPDFINTGVVVYSVKEHAAFLEDIYKRYSDTTVFDGYEQCHLSHEIIASGLFSPLPYEFNAFWTYEMATYYPFLYFPSEWKNLALRTLCKYNALFCSWFLHFPGWRFEKSFFYEILSEDDEQKLFQSVEYWNS